MTGEKLRGLRIGARLLQGEVATVLGVCAETVCRWEAGKHPISKVAEEAYLRLVNDTDRVASIRSGRRRMRREARRGGEGE